MPKKKTKVAVIGLGYVGLPLALLAEVKGYDVIGIDNNPQKIKNLKIKATSDFAETKDADIVIICVPTPVYKNRNPDYSPVKNACKSIAPYLKKGELVVLESTVNPGVCEEIVAPIIEKYSGLLVGEFLLAHCPERINPGDDKWDVSNIPRVVGGWNRQSTQKAYEFYTSILSSHVKIMNSLKEAEAVKIVENSFRNINIAFVNELAQSFSKLGIDVVNVIDGASTKPFAFMAHYPGCGVGGHCIPVDPYYLIDYAKKNGYTHRFLSLACKVNEEMPSYTVSLLKRELKKQGKKMKGSTVAVLGLSYKANIADLRESPAEDIIKHLKKGGAAVKSYDPYVDGDSKIKNLDDALESVDAVILATNHKEFLELTPEMLVKNNIKIIIDGRNCLPKKDFINAGIEYVGIGR